MIKVKTSDLVGNDLSWAVAIAAGFAPADMKRGIGYYPAKDPETAKHFIRANETYGSGFSQSDYDPVNNAELALDLIINNRIHVEPAMTNEKGEKEKCWKSSSPQIDGYYYSTAYIESALQCYIAVKLGHAVYIPDAMAKSIADSQAGKSINSQKGMKP